MTDRIGMLGRRWSQTRWWPLVRDPLRYGVVAGVLAGLLSFAVPPTYEVHAGVTVTSSAQQALGGSILGLAKEFGLSAQMGSTSPDMLGALLGTEQVLERIVRTQYPTNVFDQLWWTHCPGGSATCDLVQIWRVTGKNSRDSLERGAKKLKAALAVSVSPRTDIVGVTLKAGDPKLSLAIMERLLTVLDSTNVEIQRRQAEQQVQFIQEQFERARTALRSTEDSLATFDITNRAIQTSPYLQQQRGRLMRSVNLAETFYVQLGTALQQAYVSAANSVSTISIIDPPALPGRRSWPKRALIAIVGFLLGAGTLLAMRYGRQVAAEITRAARDSAST